MPVIKFGLNNFQAYLHDESMELYLNLCEMAPIVSETTCCLIPDLVEFLFGSKKEVEELKKSKNIQLYLSNVGFQYFMEIMPIMTVLTVRSPEIIARNHMMECLQVIENGVKLSKANEDNTLLIAAIMYIGTLVESLPGALGSHFDNIFRFVCRELKTSFEPSVSKALVKVVGA